MFDGKWLRIGLFALAVLLLGSVLHAETRLLRYPDLHGDRVAFSYAGDLWLAPDSGGTAIRLTAHPGVELFPRFSPDGNWIAFTGQYDGDEQVYVIPSGGGVPRQLTFYPAAGPLPPRWGFDNQVYDWNVDGTAVLFRSMRHGFDLTDTQLFTVPVEGGLPQSLPMPVSGAGDFSPDGTRMVYSPLVRDFRTWKRYEGGWAQDLWIFDLASHEVQRVTDHPRADRDPMWIGERIYFTSDRDGTSNLYGYDPASSTLEPLTGDSVWDVRWPGDDGRGRIVFERNGALEILDIASRVATSIVIDVPDDGLWMRPERVAAADRIEQFSLSPKGKRALFVARGDLFTAPVKEGVTRNLTRSSGAHDKWAAWSPNGKSIAYISDRTGEEELWVIDQGGAGEPRRLTTDGRVMRYLPVWSPDSERIAFSDKDGKIFVLHVADGKATEVADSKGGQVFDYSWSPRGGHLAFSLPESNGFNSIWIWSAGDGRTRRVTGEMFNELSPVWGPGGEYLYYLSDRQFAPQIASIEWNYVTDRETGIYAMALRNEVAHPFPPKDDQVEVEGEGGETKDEEKADSAKKKGKKKGDSDDETNKEEPVPVVIDFDGLAGRVTRVPVDDDNYSGLAAVKGHLLYVRGGPFYYGRASDVKSALKIYSLEDREEKTLAEGIRGYALSEDGSKALVRQRGGFKLYDVKPSAKEGKAVSTSGLRVDRVPREEWEQIFDEVWRRFRDFFYVDNMHGYDWDALGERYRAWLEHVAHRSDLNYVIGEMIAELNVGHAYISGGDYAIPPRPNAALPGADLAWDAEAGRFRIVRVYRGHNEESVYRAPLTAVGVDVRQGDYLLAIDGEPLGAGDNPYELLRHRGDRPVEWTVNERPTTDGARKATYVPVGNEDSLRYLDWVEANRRKVSEATDGRVGYLHIPNMGASGLREFIKWFYPQIRKEGLVVDVRNNGGGNVSQMLIERLGRDLLGTRFSRNNDYVRTYPAWVFHGHMACILDEDSASDGDIFPHMFRQAGLGPLIGKRSWGGVVGITSHGPLIDGGDVRVPEFGTNALDGSWIIEGRGVQPDIEVENDPKSLIAGQDPQLERAVREVMLRIEQEPKRLPDRPAPPVKTP